jgi:hypothetical protein
MTRAAAAAAEGVQEEATFRAAAAAGCVQQAAKAHYAAAAPAGSAAADCQLEWFGWVRGLEEAWGELTQAAVPAETAALQAADISRRKGTTRR